MYVSGYMKNLILIFLAMFLAMAADAASPYFQRIDSETDGLSHNGVRCLLQDSRGYVWIGTQMGLDRYDGTRIKIFSGDDLPSTYIFTLCEDKRGNIWIGTGNGISVYDYEHDRIFEPKMADGTRLNLAIYSITCNSSGEIWFDARKDVLFSFDYNDGFVKTRNVNFKRETIKRIAFNANDCLVICSHMDNVYLCPQGGNAEPLELRSGAELIKDDEIYGPVFTRKSKSVFYVATKRSGVVEINMKERSARLLFRWNALQKPNGIALQDERYIIAATTSGLVRYDIITEKKEEYYNITDDAHSLSDNFVICTMVDMSGGVWAGTAQYGVCYTNKALDCFRRLAATSDGMSLKGCNTKGICEDKNGDLWITTERAGLLKYSPSKGKMLRVRSTKIPDFLTDIIADGENLWIGTQFGILRYTPLTGEVREYKEFGQEPFSQDSRVICMSKSSAGQIYVGASASTMAYDRESDSFKAISQAGVRAYESIVEDADGRLWLGSYSQGLHSMDPHDGFAMVSYPDCIQTMISTVIRDINGDICVIGYDSVISRYDAKTGSFETFTPDNTYNLPESSFVSARADKNNHLWIGTTDGLVDLDTKNRTCVVYTVDNGLTDDYFSKASLELSDGQMMFGSRDGLVLFNPEVVGRERVPARVDIISMKIGDREIVPSPDAPIDRNINEVREITLSSLDNYFSLDFASPLSDMTTEVFCCLEGYDTEPHNVSTDKSISYYGLLPGKYTLKLTAHPDVTITVEPPFWQSRLGVAVIMLILVGLAAAVSFVVYSWQRRVQKNRMDAYKREKEKSIVQDKMEFLSNVVHEIKTPLTLMKTPLQSFSNMQGMTEEDRKNLQILCNSTDYLDRLSKELLTFITVSEFKYVVDMNPMDIVEQISSICYNYSEAARSRNIRLTFVHSEDVIMVNADSAAMSKILNNLFSNALKYTDSYIEIEAKVVGRQVLVCVRNDGDVVPHSKRNEIFKPFVTLKDKSSVPVQSFGIGLPLARRLSELHGGTLTISDADRTEFVLSIPVYNMPECPEISDVSVPESDKPTLLIIEDNRELLDFLSDRLSSEFNTVISDNVNMAFTIISKFRINLILADLNMPGTNGLDFCRKLNVNAAASHIPVVIMSATTSEKAKIQCLESGAVLYIEKPFTVEYLSASLKSVLNSRVGVSGKNTRQIDEIDMTQYGVEDKDALFLKNLDDIVTKNLGDDSFGVRQLEEALFVSHSTLNRRMAELLQMSPVDYIKKKRLNAALVLLEQKKLTVSEVAYSVGFSSLSYFSRCFKDYYGKSPADYMK